MTESATIVWFRNDLRLHDHPALTAAVKRGGPVIALFILDDAAAGRWKLGGASRWWLTKSLEALSHDIAQRGARLILRRGDTESILKRLVDESGVTAIYVTRSYEPWATGMEEKLHKSFGGSGVVFKRFGGRLLREPEDLRTSSGAAYQVFTPFWRAFRKEFSAPKALAAPRHLGSVPDAIASDDISDWKLAPTKPDWSGGLAEAWRPGERGAQLRLKNFVSEGLANYDDGRDRLYAEGTSRLSPHLAFGEISPAACWRAAAEASHQTHGGDGAVETFLKELAWREFSYALLFQFPQMPDEPLRDEFAAFPWAKSSANLKEWQRGLTGYPVVDAGMRELWATGYMHNRARMIAASFLTKHLLLPWTSGEAWFWDTLVDADLANNAANWQWVAGCGADAAPYFRIFNPVLQGEKFDPDGDYVRRWVPELQRLPSADIHKPWAADATTLKRAGVVIGKNYPFPIVDHKEARARALTAYDRVKSGKRG
ncbi:cryptochrome/photolyase family protein [Hyphomicrobium sp. DY-1]|uniref:cryptochrome/photolyase family protein n=1 Tax=Hyphomicrobium sp. DY-1 TaxID=3075650 RepID=UPI0039C1EB42